MDELTMGPMDELVALLADAPEPVSVATDPAEVRVPGGWLALDDLRPVNLAGAWELRTSLYLIGPDTGAARGLAHAMVLLNRATTAGVLPDGPVTTTGVVLPGDPTPLPALRVPVHLYT